MALRIPVNQNDHIQGNPNALIELIEYGDYQCPHCWRAYPVVKKLQQQLGDRLKLVFRNFPLTKVHPNAMIAAMASEAAALQGKYWEMHDMLFEKHLHLDYESLVRYAQKLELNTEQFEKDMARTDLTEKIEDEFLSGLRSGVNATPGFFINGEKYNDSWEGNNLLEFIWMAGLLR